MDINPLTPENKSLRATLPAEIFVQVILIFKELTARRLCKSFGVKGLRTKGTISAFRLKRLPAYSDKFPFTV
jgi:hypothetical protein